MLAMSEINLMKYHAHGQRIVLAHQQAQHDEIIRPSTKAYGEFEIKMGNKKLNSKIEKAKRK
jgi:hypothetical protein